MDEMKPWWKTWPVLGVAALLVVLALGGGGMILGSKLGEAGGSETVPASPASGEAGGGSSGAPADGEASVCGLTAREDELGKLETEAPKTEWESLGNQLVTKQNDEHGPGVVEEDGFRYCYARTPEGALFAVANAASMMAGDAEVSRRTIEAYVLDGPAKDQMLEMSSTTSPGNAKPVIRGYRFDAYQSTHATLTLLLEKDGSFGSVTADAVWSQGTWQIKPAGDGHIVYNRQAVDNEAGFVMWGLSHG